MPKRKTAADYHALAEERGFEWIGEGLPPNVVTKTLWRCSKGHEWQAIYNNIQQGSGCPHCAGKAPKTEADYHALAAERVFEWIAESLPQNAHAPTAWRCFEGHEWQAPYNGLRQGNGCPHCTGRALKTTADYRDIGKARGIEWIGESLPQNNHTKTLWRCSKGHEWQTRYCSIQQGRGCPRCQNMVNGVRVSKPQRALAARLEGVLNYPCGRRRIDVALLDDRIAVEYDETHWHTETGEQAAERDRELLIAGWKVLHIRAHNSIPGAASLADALDILKNTPATALTLLCGALLATDRLPITDKLPITDSQAVTGKPSVDCRLPLDLSGWATVALGDLHADRNHSRHK